MAGLHDRARLLLYTVQVTAEEHSLLNMVAIRRGAALKQPEDVRLRREEGEALIERIERDALSAEDRRLLVKLLTFYVWLLFALREAKLSLKRLKALVFGEKPKKPKPPSSGGAAGGGSGGERETQTNASQGGPSLASAGPAGQKPPPPA